MRFSTRVLFVLALVVGDVIAGGAEGPLLFEPKKLTKEQQAIVNAAPLGSEGNPVRCAHAAGERSYLSRLLCPSGKAPEYERGGSVGFGPYGMIMDHYEVRCPEWPDAAAVYMDMYHQGYEETRAVPRFTIKAPK